MVVGLAQLVRPRRDHRLDRSRRPRRAGTTSIFAAVIAIGGAAPASRPRPGWRARCASGGAACAGWCSAGARAWRSCCSSACRRRADGACRSWTAPTALGGRLHRGAGARRRLGVRARPGWRTPSRYVVGGRGRRDAVQAVNGQMLGLSRLTYSLATNRQIPSSARAAASAATRPPTSRSRSRRCSPSRSRCPPTWSSWPGIFAFGAMLAFTLAHLSVIVLRFTEPDRPQRRSACRSRSRSARGRSRSRPRLGALIAVRGPGSA